MKVPQHQHDKYNACCAITVYVALGQLLRFWECSISSLKKENFVVDHLLCTLLTELVGFGARLHEVALRAARGVAAVAAGALQLRCQRRRSSVRTLNCCRRCETPEELAELESYVAAHARFWIDHLHSDVMRTTASPERMRHLRQVMEHESHLPALAAKARAEAADAE